MARGKDSQTQDDLFQFAVAGFEPEVPANSVPISAREGGARGLFGTHADAGIPPLPHRGAVQASCGPVAPRSFIALWPRGLGMRVCLCVLSLALTTSLPSSVVSSAPALSLHSVLRCQPRGPSVPGQYD